ncbi:Integrator complex subunit 9 [Coemansia sp. RSA 1813]|nr:Integrator complex subunit 9 [Coemansia sp. RSA 1646]KAJ1773798.1 Integrator complex subunit 9 [Coemansia sp. RSA 1843]KAJ2093761.1 Integrator complex subunit 9 [Coemansia sp. RSA 986]KAJ2217972.1 Integrator complex subunit 9 [Coemansia sp. RSA 487]KAJ2573185.1 Integrator complex subunit 9 [Coemansia sp. RSA 1813]
MPSISVISFSPYERYHLLLCELDDTMFVVDCGWPTDPYSTTHNTESGKTSTAFADSTHDPRDVLSTINWARIDFILISNHEQMTLLPYITEYTEFSGPVYATEPAKVYGRCVLEAGVVFAARAGTARANSSQYEQLLATGPLASTSSSAQPRHQQHNFGKRGGARMPLYSQQDIVATMEKITDVRHNEIVSPVPFVQAYTRSSGYCIGGANWTIEYKGHRTAFVSTSSFAACLHPQEWDGRVLSEAHVIVFCDASDPAANESDTSEANVPQNIQVSQRMNQLCSTAMATLRQRSRVLLIGEPYGVTQDILQLVAENVASLNLPVPQFIVVSPVGERTLQYGNIMGEWLCEGKQSLLYLPEYPFADKDLRLKGHLHFVRSLTDLAVMKVPQGTWFVIASPQDVPAIEHFIQQWKKDASNSSGVDIATSSGAARFSVLMHSDDLAWAQSLVRRLSVGSELTYVPVSCRLTFRNIEQSLASAERAQQVLVPSSIYTRLSPTGEAGGSGVPRSLAGSGLEFKLFEYSYLQATTVDLDTDRHLPLSIQKDMTQQMRKSGKQHAIVSGTLSFAAGKIRLEHENATDKESEAAETNESAGLHSAGIHAPNTVGPTELIASKGGLDIGAAKIDLSQWTPERLASELNDIGINAAVLNDAGIKIVVPGGSATVRIRDGWSVDCTSTGTQWTVMDSLRQVLKPAQP